MSASSSSAAPEFPPDLSSSQRTALTQVLELTGNCDVDVAVAVLTSVDWDVQRAAEMIFGGGGGPPPPPAPEREDRPAMEEFEIDDTEQDDLLGPRRPRAVPGHTTPLTTLLLRPIVSLLSLPLTLLSNLLRLLFTVLRVPFPGPLLRFSGLTFLRRPPSSSSGSTPTYRSPEAWIRELEEETGAISIGRLKVPKGTSSSIPGEASGSGLTARNVGAAGFNDVVVEEGRKLLPDFMATSYEEALRTAQREARVICVVLVSDEHDDVAEFKRSTLTNTSLVRTLHNNDILVWGGDVKDREAHAASEKLQATTYPFVAFVALQPRRTPSSRSSSSSTSSNTAPPTLTVLSRHAGPSSGPTSADSLTAHIQTQVLPRVSSYLQRLRAVQAQHARDRALREDQDRAFASAAQRDKERIQARMAQEQAAAQARRLAEEERERERRRAEDEERERVRRREVREGWRRWTRRALVSAHASSSSSAGGDGKKGSLLRFAIRLPAGERVVRQFDGATDDLTSLYAFIDAQLLPPSLSPSTDPSAPPSPSSPSPNQSPKDTLESYIATHSKPSEYWGFVLASSFPRAEIPWAPGTPLGEVPLLQGGGQLVVELTAGSRSPSVAGARSVNGDDSDGYETEED